MGGKHTIRLTPYPIIPKRRAPLDPGLGPPEPLLAGPDGTGLAWHVGAETLPDVHRLR